MKTWIKGTNATVLSLAVVGIFIVLTIFLHSLKGVQIDVTANKKFTLSESTITTLQKLDKPVHVIAFTDPGAGVVDRQIKDLLDEYHKRNSKFTYEEVDPKQKPTIAEQYKIDQYGTLVFESNGKTKNVYSSDLFGQGSDPNSDPNSSYSFSGEEKFTQAIISLTSDVKHKVYFITGHGEMSSTNGAGQLSSALQGENYDVADLNIVQQAKIPDDADAVFVLGPQFDISDSEAAVLKKYLQGKGKLMFSLDLAKDMDKWKNWPDILNIYGVKSLNALAIESQQALAQDPRLIVPQFGFHDIVNKLDDQKRIVVLPIAMALSQDKNNKDYGATTLLKTTDKAYGKTNLSVFTSAKQITANDIQKASGDVNGPLDLAYAITSNADAGKPRAIIIGNGLMMSDNYLTQQANRDFALNSVAWLQEQQDQITIRPQEEQLQQVMIMPGKQKLIFAGTVVLFPLFFLLVGFTVWWRRRKG